MGMRMQRVRRTIEYIGPKDWIAAIMAQRTIRIAPSNYQVIQEISRETMAEYDIELEDNGRITPSTDR